MMREQALVEWRGYYLPGIQRQEEMQRLSCPDFDLRRKSWNTFLKALKASGRIGPQRYAAWYASAPDKRRCGLCGKETPNLVNVALEAHTMPDGTVPIMSLCPDCAVGPIFGTAKKEKK